MTDSSWKADFPRICKELRLAARLKHREAAAGIGIGTSTYSNMESQSFVVVGESTVRKIVRFYSLDDKRAAELTAAWRELPVRQSTQRTRDAWKRKNAIRNKAKNHDRVALACASFAALYLLQLSDESAAVVCRCDFESTCEVCAGLQTMGLPPYDDRDSVIARIAKLQARLEVGAEAANGAPAEVVP